MKVGDLVRVIRSNYPWNRFLGELGVVMNNGTWSADVYVFGSNSSWWPRFDKDHLEVIA